LIKSDQGQQLQTPQQQHMQLQQLSAGQIQPNMIQQQQQGPGTRNASQPGANLAQGQLTNSSNNYLAMQKYLQGQPDVFNPLLIKHNGNDMAAITEYLTTISQQAGQNQRNLALNAVQGQQGLNLQNLQQQQQGSNAPSLLQLQQLQQQQQAQQQLQQQNLQQQAGLYSQNQPAQRAPNDIGLNGQIVPGGQNNFAQMPNRPPMAQMQSQQQLPQQARAAQLLATNGFATHPKQLEQVGLGA
jgi:hypothetical protein